MRASIGSHPYSFVQTGNYYIIVVRSLPGGFIQALQANDVYTLHFSVDNHPVSPINDYAFTARHVYANPGTYNVTVTVQDDDGGKTTSSVRTITIADTTPPTVSATAVTPNPRNTSVGSLVITFSETVQNFGLSDLKLTRNGGTVNLLDGSGATLVANGNGQWTLGNLASLTNTDGNYELVLARTGLGIVDGVGLPLANDLRVQWSAFITAPIVTVDSLTTIDTRPRLTGTVDDRSATVAVTVNGISYPATNNGDGTWRLSANVIATLSPGVYNVSVAATNAFGTIGNDSTSGELTISAPTPMFRIGEPALSPSGFSLAFNSAPDFSLLNLYDGVDSSVDLADVTLVGANVGAMRGSLAWDANTKLLHFIKTGGPLEADSYTVTVSSRADGLRLATGEYLDGNNNGTIHDYVRTFNVAPSTARVVSLPDFSRGATSTAGQSVNLSYDNGNPGVPVTISDGADVLAVDFDVTYNPALINFTSTFVNVLPAGWTTTVNLVSSGRMRLTMSGSTPLGAGPQIVTRLLAGVPANAPYGASDLVRIQALRVFTAAGGSTPVPSIADAGLHKAIFVGDTNGDGLYTAQDAGWTAGVQVGAYTGFDAYSWTDPSIVADVNQNGSLDGLDSSWIARKGLNNNLQPEIPNLPAGSISVQAGIDPTIAADALVPTRRGATVNLPIRITDSAAGLWGVDVFLDYNTNLLDLPSGLNVGGATLAGMFTTESGWSIDSYADDSTGTLRLAMYRATPSTQTAGVIGNIAFTVKPNAAFGVTPITVDGNANVPPFSFSFVSGSVNVINSAPTDISLDQNTVLENTSTTASDLLFGQLGTADLDPVDSYIYDLVAGTGDNDNAKFRIVDDKVYIKQGEILDFEVKPTYSVRVRTTDSGGLAFAKPITLRVTDVNESVMLTVANATLTGNVLITFTNTGTWADPENGSVTLSASLGAVVKNANGTWSWSYTPSTKLTNQLVTITANDGRNTSTKTFTISALVAVTNRQVYYKGSGFASVGGVAAALDTSKVLLQSGATSQATTFANVVNYSRGINGVVIDVAGLESTNLTAADFTFRTGNTNTPNTWQNATNPTLIAATPGTATTPARIRLEWADNAIQNTWLQIIVKANANTGLSQRSVSYLGHALGEVNGTGTPLRVTNADLLLVQSAVSASVVPVTDIRDVNKDRRITNADLLLVQSRVSATGVISMITIPAAGSAAEG